MEQSVIGWIEEVDPLDGSVIDRPRPGEPVEGTHTGRKVIERGEMLQITAVTGEQNLTQVAQAVYGLFDGSQFPRWRSLTMFHLAVVLEKGHVVSCRFDTKHASELVVHLDRGSAVAVLDAGSLDPGGELRPDLLGQLRGDLTAEESGDLLGFHTQHRLAGELFIQRLQRGGGAEYQVGGVFNLHQGPMVGLPERVE